ncbi:putative metabolite transport protein CsbC [Rubripirellula amarantea]|uniref:Putative metabolite transport protein CsbC n=1 Tax=Rubripirellula amarantea TaxID=2527999 RepID=A0A5C5WG51_9BACT|nr:sugar porter family MFS transporter [Rubripirellula amarantea]TWT49748.1 putative metabolite transport protein CsbC [Rubripirellula amarantea]
MQSKVFFWSLSAALAGFLFGFDTVVISGAEKTIQSLWGLDNAMHGLAISMALWGTVLGSLVGGIPTDRWGRKRTLISIGALYTISAVWSGMATDEYSFMIARFIGGLGVGISTVTAPLYISEIAPPERRGRLAGMFQFNIVLGILIAFLSNYLIGRFVQVDAWRWMLGIEALPAIIYTVMCWGIPQSPRWLIAKRSDRAAAVSVLRQVNENASEAEIQKLADEIEKSAFESGGDGSQEPFWTWRLKTPILLAFMVAFFNQLSGINAILYFAPRIFQLAGLGENASLLNSIGIGVTNLLFTFLGLYLIDRMGRRALLYVGSFGYIASLGICAWTFLAHAPAFEVANAAMSVQSASGSLAKVQALPNPDLDDVSSLSSQLSGAVEKYLDSLASNQMDAGQYAVGESTPQDELNERTTAAMDVAAQQSGSGGNVVMICIFSFIAAHAVGQGAVIWVLISEIFPNRHRAAGQSLGSFTHWIFAALLTMVFPWMINTFAPGYVFGFFCFMMVLQLVWVATLVPETKGVPLEDMEAKLGIRELAS